MLKLNRISGMKKKPKKEADELFKEHLDELLKMTDVGADFKDSRKKLWKRRWWGQKWDLQNRPA